MCSRRICESDKGAEAFEWDTSPFWASVLLCAKETWRSHLARQVCGDNPRTEQLWQLSQHSKYNEHVIFHSQGHIFGRTLEGACSLCYMLLISNSVLRSVLVCCWLLMGTSKYVSMPKKIPKTRRNLKTILLRIVRLHPLKRATKLIQPLTSLMWESSRWRPLPCQVPEAALENKCHLPVVHFIISLSISRIQFTVFSFKPALSPTVFYLREWADTWQSSFIHSPNISRYFLI